MANPSSIRAWRIPWKVKPRGLQSIGLHGGQCRLGRGSGWGSSTSRLPLLLQFSSVSQSCPTLCDPMDCTVDHQTPLSMEFSRQEYWSGLPFPSPADLPDLGIKPRYPALQADSFPYELQGSSSIPYPKVKIKLLRLLNN